MMILALRARGLARAWGPVIGVVCGCVVGAVFGTYDIQRVIDADWIGVPRFSAWPGLDFGALRHHFWLIPSFSFLSLVGAIETVGTAIQKVSWRTPRATDYKLVQGAVATDGFGNLLGLFGTVPTYSRARSWGFRSGSGWAFRTDGSSRSCSRAGWRCCWATEAAHAGAERGGDRGR